MADAGSLRDEFAHGLVRARRPARGRGDDDAGPVPVAAKVTLYHAPDCGLCEHALAVVRDAQAVFGFTLELVDIAGDDELERRYRVELPVLEIDGERAFAYFVDADALRDRLSR